VTGTLHIAVNQICYGTFSGLNSWTFGAGVLTSEALPRQSPA